MIRRTLIDTHDYSAVEVLVADTLTEAFAAIAGAIAEYLQDGSTAIIGVWADTGELSGSLATLENTPRTEISVREAAGTPFYHGMPRADVTLYRPESACRPAEEIATWKVLACPAGIDERVHEIAETLLFDAHERGEDLEETAAYRIAEALLGIRPGPPLTQTKSLGHPPKCTD